MAKVSKRRTARIRRWRRGLRWTKQKLTGMPRAVRIAGVAAVLARAGDVKPTSQQTQDVAAIVHLCGGGPAIAFARRRFQMMASERCGDHSLAGYVSRVNALKRSFLQIAAESGK